MKQVKTELILNAPPDRIWNLLYDFSLYPEWNPLIVSAVGTRAAGCPLDLVVRLPGIDPFRLRSSLISIEPSTQLGWRWALSSKLLVAWTFQVRLEQVSSDRVLIAQSSEFTGLFAPLFCFALNRSFAAGMHELNQALTRWGEKGNVRCMRC